MKDSDVDVGILGLGSFVPPSVRTNEFWPESFLRSIEERRNQDFLAIDRDSTGQKKPERIPPEIAEAMVALGDDPFFGARRRHVIDDGVEASDMEAEAARRAMRDAGVTPSEIDLVLVHSLVPDLLMPSNAPAVQAKCEIVNASAWSLDVSCSSFIGQMIAATALVRAGLYHKVLLVFSQAASRVLDYGSAGSTAFGDGAAAVVVGRVPKGYGLRGHYLRTDGTLRDGVVIAPLVDGAPQRRWDLSPANPCFTSFDKDLGKITGVRSTEFCREASFAALEAAGLSIDDVALYVGSQSLGWLVDACRRGLGLPAERAFDTFREVAGLGAVAVPYNLDKACERGMLRDGDIVLMYSPGAGFTRGALAYRWRAPAGGKRNNPAVTQQG